MVFGPLTLLGLPAAQSEELEAFLVEFQLDRREQPTLGAARGAEVGVAETDQVVADAEQHVFRRHEADLRPDREAGRAAAEAGPRARAAADLDPLADRQADI